MAVDRWDPVRDLRHLKERVDTLFRDVLGRAGNEAATEIPGTWRPPVDVWEEGDSYHVRVDLPGVAAGRRLDRDRRRRLDDPRRAPRRERRCPTRTFFVRSGRTDDSRCRWRFPIPSILKGSTRKQKDGVLEILLANKRDDRGGARARRAEIDRRLRPDRGRC